MSPFRRGGKTVFRLAPLEPLLVRKVGCPVCGGDLFAVTEIVSVHEEPGGECPASGMWWEIAVALGKIRQADPRLLDRAHP